MSYTAPWIWTLWKESLSQLQHTGSVQQAGAIYAKQHCAPYQSTGGLVYAGLQCQLYGETYEEKYRPYDDTIDQGDSIKILVDPADPEDLPRKEPGLTTVSAVFFAGFCLLLGLLTVKPLLEQKRFQANYQQ